MQESKESELVLAQGDFGQPNGNALTMLSTAPTILERPARDLLEPLAISGTPATVGPPASFPANSQCLYEGQKRLIES
jgi:hypothetical protein